jgi:formylglycine-generating enzyme required for sulfatase activity
MSMVLFSRREWLKFATGSGLAALAGQRLSEAARTSTASEDEPDFNAALIRPPENPELWPSFREKLQRWRRESRQRLKYDDSAYRRPEFEWTQSCFACGFVMLFDEMFFNRDANHYRVDEFLEASQRDFGGFDAVVLWHAYPRIGLDDRNQFDFYRNTPGGLPGLRELVGRLHARGVRSFVDYNPWDTGTRREGMSDIDALGILLEAIDADGVFLDTLDKAAGGLRERLDRVRPGLALESEAALPLEQICDHQLSWAQWFEDKDPPGVLRNKWFEPRHVLHQINRWDRDHSAELHRAWLNGTGILVWENVFGSWVGWNARDKSILRAMLPIQRRHAKLLTAGEWSPLVRCLRPDIYASEWRSADGIRLWTLVNRSNQPVDGSLLRVPLEDDRVFDLIKGVAAEPLREGPEAVLSGRILARGVGAFAAGPAAALGGDFPAFLNSITKLTEGASGDSRFVARIAEPVPVAPVRVAPAPAGMIAIPAVRRKMKTEFRVRECGFFEAQDEEFVGARYPRLHHKRIFEREVQLPAYCIDRTPVTNGQYAAFLESTGYKPRVAESFLRHWKGSPRPPAVVAYHPVVYVELDDARAFARWAGKRLPTELEWQYAAQGDDDRAYPWGDEEPAGRCNDGVAGGTTPVGAFPSGASAFGCLDLCGNVWEWTESERRDGRTRFAILKGGSYYRAAGSEWYMDGGPQRCDFAAKVLLWWPGLDRCATVGFRCAADLK